MNFDKEKAQIIKDLAILRNSCSTEMEHSICEAAFILGYAKGRLEANDDLAKAFEKIEKLVPK